MQPVLLTNTYLSECYSASYSEAQHRFRQKVQQHSGLQRYTEYSYPMTGPDAEPLTTSVAWQGPLDARKVLVIQSATHGVEGFCGSAIQLDTINSLTADFLADDIAILYIHAVNPFGFAWLRRVNGHGVALN